MSMWSGLQRMQSFKCSLTSSPLLHIPFHSASSSLQCALRNKILCFLPSHIFYSKWNMKRNRRGEWKGMLGVSETKKSYKWNFRQSIKSIHIYNIYGCNNHEIYTWILDTERIRKVKWGEERGVIRDDLENGRKRTVEIDSRTWFCTQLLFVVMKKGSQNIVSHSGPCSALLRYISSNRHNTPSEQNHLTVNVRCLKE